MEKEKCIKMLQDVIQIQSENGNEEAVARYYQERLAEHGIPSELVKYAEGRSSLVAEISNGPGRVLALSGHMDVVSAGDASQWTHPPFSGHIEDDVIWGRGTADMKGGLTALLIAFIEAHKKRDFKGKLKFLATVGEEVGELGSRQLTDLGYIDDVNAILIGEPFAEGVVYTHKGSLNYKVISRGVEAHSSLPELGSNAIEHLVRAMNLISDRVAERADLHENKVLGKTFNNMTLIHGGRQVNSIPDYAEFEANARTIPEFDNDAVIREVRQVVDALNEEKGYQLELIVTADNPPVQSDPNSRLIQSILRAAAEKERLKPYYLLRQMAEFAGADVKETILSRVDSDELKPMVVSGTTDAAQFIRGNPQLEVAIYGPGMSMVSHKVDERLPLSRYFDFIEIYQEVIKTYLA